MIKVIHLLLLVGCASGWVRAEETYQSQKITLLVSSVMQELRTSTGADMAENVKILFDLKRHDLLALLLRERLNCTKTIFLEAGKLPRATRIAFAKTVLEDAEFFKEEKIGELNATRIISIELLKELIHTVAEKPFIDEKNKLTTSEERKHVIEKLSMLEKL